MNTPTIVDRVRSEFVEMPGLELTLPQAGRLWNLDAHECQRIIDALVHTGFLRWTARRTVVRTGREVAFRAEAAA